MLNKPKILAIDDEVKALNLLKLNLEAFGFSVSIAGNGADGLKLAVSEHPDLIILDIRMPKMDGWEVCKYLKSVLETKDIPIVILSAFSNTWYQKRATDFGVNAYFTKPIDPNKFAVFISEMLENK
jgi:DNA-binding response OmpR family regulator